MLFPRDLNRAWGNAPWAAVQTVHNGWRLPACLPRRLSSSYNGVVRPECPGAVPATSDRPAIAMCICTAALFSILPTSNTRKIDYDVSNTYFFHSLHIMEQ